MNKIYKLGIDIGSTTAKFVLLNENNEIKLHKYLRHNTKINETFIELLDLVKEKFGELDLKIKFTGSAGMGVSERTELPFIQEVVASNEIIKHKYPEVKTLIDIGGEDSKMLFFHKNKAPDIRMNGSCAGGTGAFIDQMATLMNIKLSDFNELARNSTNKYSIASRCGVFAKTDIQNLLSRKIPVEDIAASVFHAIVLQTMNTLARGYDIVPKIMFIGGPFKFFSELQKTFINNLNLNNNDVIVPENPSIIPALGTAFSINETNKSFKINELKEKILQTTNKSFEINNRLTPLFKDKKEFTDWKTEKSKNNINLESLDKYQGEKLFLGIDSGSTTTKIVVIGKDNELLYKYYANNKANSIETLKQGLFNFQKINTKNLKISQSVVTGYGEDLIKAAFSIDMGVVETIAHTKGAIFFDKDVTFILDIGGQDMKAIFVNNGIVNRIELNESCSSGCGSFIETFGNSLDYKVTDFAQIACEATQPYDLGTRCTVFMNSKVKQAIKENATVKDISAGLSVSVIKNALYKVLKLKDLSEIGKNIVVQGGTFKNKSVLKALEDHLQTNVTVSNIPELMGAFGSALMAKEKYVKEEKYEIENMKYEKANNLDIIKSSDPSKRVGTLKEPISKFIGLENLQNIDNYTTKQLVCKGCENRCVITRFKFSNNETYFSGNKCEKIFTNKGEKQAKGTNLLQIKNELLFKNFNLNLEASARPSIASKLPIIGIPRVLNLFENYPFWNALFTDLNFKVKLSSPSTMNLYEQGAGSVMSDNICFPAKLVHGHINDLIAQNVARIFYPMIFYEKNIYKKSENNFNCPIVAAYPDVIRSSMKLEIPFDTPTLNFDNEKLLKKEIFKYVKQFGIKKQRFENAFEKAIISQDEFSITIKQKALKLIEKAKKNNTLLIVLAGRPYHTDPLIHQNTPNILSDFGVDVITEDSLPNILSIEELQIISQWTYPNRVLNAAQWVAKQPNNIQFVQINSFGCGPDAILIDECKDILKTADKSHTVIRVDEITSIGSIKLRLRSLIESLKNKEHTNEINKNERKTVKIYETEDRRRTIIAPYFAEFYSELIPDLFKVAGYNVVNLPKPDKKSVDYGLKYSNNEICYPATIVVGDVIKALKSGKYDRNDITVGITQTGGQCRASTYLSLIKKAMLDAGYEDIPVISVGTSGKTINTQPGFEINWLKLLPITLAGMLYTDSLSKMYYATIVKEKKKGECDKLKEKYLDIAKEYVRNKDVGKLFNLLKQSVKSFNEVEISEKKYHKIAIVGEIYVKYNHFGHHFVSDWLIEQGVEVVFPPLLEFFTQEFVNIKVNQKANLTKTKFSTNIFVYLFEKYANRYISRTNKIVSKFRSNIQFHDVKKIAKKAEKILSLTNQYGEGWLIPAEIAGFAEEGINNVVSVQPFGCIANQIVSKGVEKRIKEIYPDLSLLFLDFDNGTSNANILNRLHFMINNFE